MTRYGRRDGNHAAIRDFLREVGWSVLDLGDRGDGCPDLLVGAAGVNVLLEVKLPGREGDLEPAQVTFHTTWRGQVSVVSSCEVALDIVTKEVARRGRNGNGN